MLYFYAEIEGCDTRRADKIRFVVKLFLLPFAWNIVRKV